MQPDKTDVGGRHRGRRERSRIGQEAFMNRLLRKIEAALAAVAFAEEGDADTARRIMAEAGTDQMADPQRKQADSASGLSPRAPLAKGSRA
jgi:hypothetical protein